MATHSSVLAWRIPGMGEPGGLPSVGLRRVRHNWSNLAAAAAAAAWLSSAIEGPISISALLHSSTIVGEGIILLVCFNPLTENNHLIQTIMFRSHYHTVYNNMCYYPKWLKKNIAFSTSSQLGLMIVTIGINQPYLAFLLICTYDFFKAILFICSGSMSEQWARLPKNGSI